MRLWLLCFAFLAFIALLALLLYLTSQLPAKPVQASAQLQKQACPMADPCVASIYFLGPGWYAEPGDSNAVFINTGYAFVEWRDV